MDSAPTTANPPMLCMSRNCVSASATAPTATDQYTWHTPRSYSTLCSAWAEVRWKMTVTWEGGGAEG